MENNKSGPFLNDEAVLAIVKQSTVATVYLAALDCNWTNKNNIGDEADYFSIWAAVSFYEEKDKVFLQAARFSNWNKDFEMKLVGTVGKIGLYGFSLNNQNEFPNEFVLRLERETGEQFYDNNNYRNYSIEHSRGHYATAISQGGSVFSFDSIIPIKVI